jgi:hypothetical protein
MNRLLALFFGVLAFALLYRVLADLTSGEAPRIASSADVAQ